MAANAKTKITVVTSDATGDIEGTRLDERGRREAARSVTQASGEYMKYLADWRRKSLENATHRIVGPGSP